MALLDNTFIAKKNLNHLTGSPYAVGDEVPGSDFDSNDHAQKYLANGLVDVLGSGGEGVTWPLEIRNEEGDVTGYVASLATTVYLFAFPGNSVVVGSELTGGISVADDFVQIATVNPLFMESAASITIIGDIEHTGNLTSSGEVTATDGVTSEASVIAGQDSQDGTDGFIAFSADGTPYKLIPPNGGGSATWVAL